MSALRPSAGPPPAAFPDRRPAHSLALATGPAAPADGTAEDDGLAPCRGPLALRLTLAALGAAAVALLPFAADLHDWLWRLPAVAVGVVAAMLLWLPAICALRGPLARRPGAGAAALVAVAGLLAATGGWGLCVLLGTAPLHRWGLTSAAACGAAGALALWAWLVQRARAGRPVRDAARLAELQSRIRPHFLFNALNTALALVQADPPRAEGVLEDLAQLFRAALAESAAAVSLAEEVELARRYLDIEQLRFGERLRLVWDLDDAAAAARLPPLVLQPLVENAVRHGIEPSPRGGTVRVRSRARGGMAVLEVVNELPPAGAAQEPTGGHGLALANVRERLHLLHDVAGRLQVERRDGRHVARIEVPL